MTVQMGTMKGDVRLWFVSILINNDSGFPHSTDVDNPEWIRNSVPTAEASLKLRKQLRMEREGYSITINNIVLFP
jgi:hypothetical protein